jgi:hypothetical protein
MTYGRVSVEASYDITAAAIYVVNFSNLWLDPSNAWDNTNNVWGLVAGVYEIGTNITMRNNPNSYAVRIVSRASATTTILATSNSISHLAGTSGTSGPSSDWEHTTHLSTIVQLTNDSDVWVELDLPNTAACTVVGSYSASPTYYEAFDSDSCAYTLTDFWFHRLI